MVKCGSCCSFRGSWESCLIHAADVHLDFGRGKRAGGTCLGVFHIEILSEATSVDRISGEKKLSEKLRSVWVGNRGKFPLGSMKGHGSLRRR